MGLIEKIFVKINFFFLIISCLFRGTFISPFSKITFYNNLKIGKNCRVSEGCVFRAPKTAELVIGDNCDFREFSQVQCRENAKTEFGNNCSIQPFCFLNDKIKIGDNAILAPHCVLAAARHNFQDISKPINRQGSSSLQIEIGNNVWIGTHAIILGPCKIGSDSIIGAGVIIDKQDIPEKSIVKGERKISIIKRK